MKNYRQYLRCILLGDIHYESFKDSFKNAHSFLDSDEAFRASLLDQFLKDIYRPELNIKSRSSLAKQKEKRNASRKRIQALLADAEKKSEPQWKLESYKNQLDTADRAASRDPKSFIYQIPVYLKYENGDTASFSFSSAKLTPGPRTLTNAAEGLIGLSRDAVTTYISQGQYWYSKSGHYDQEKLSKCYTLVVDLDDDRDMYSLPADERLSYLYDKYPELNGRLKPAYIAATGRKGVHVIYCFKENVAPAAMQGSYKQILGLLNDRLGGDSDKTPVGLIRMPYSRRQETECLEAGPYGDRVEDPYIIYRNPSGPVHYADFCRTVSDFFIDEHVIYAPIKPYRAYNTCRKTYGRNRKGPKRGGYRCTTQAQKIWEHNENRIKDIRKIVNMRGRRVTGMRDSILYLYGAAVYSTRKDPDVCGSMIMDLNDSFSEPMPENQAASIIRYFSRKKQHDGFVKNVSDQRMAEMLGLSRDEMEQLENLYTRDAKKARKRTLYRTERAGAGKNGRSCVFNRYIGKLIRASRETRDLSHAVKHAVNRENVPRSTAYKMLKKINDLFLRLFFGAGGRETADGRADSSNVTRSGFDDVFRKTVSGSRILLSGMNAGILKILKRLFWHMIRGDSSSWIKSGGGAAELETLYNDTGGSINSPELKIPGMPDAAPGITDDSHDGSYSCNCPGAGVPAESSSYDEYGRLLRQDRWEECGYPCIPVWMDVL